MKNRNQLIEESTNFLIYQLKEILDVSKFTIYQLEAIIHLFDLMNYPAWKNCDIQYVINYIKDEKENG